ncbi:unnamed protein product [Rhizoctonia solani]|uniref:Uncharacterized protein n=1 Tax=Rhizoctonia solani TaxID=456999 RepID=A0A8H3DKZ1_9AGAM|nr:unnamed protein product [Rhizoctonia solani]CAE6532658.1 unnamed protein product [Rhizoctonia solani]
MYPLLPNRERHSLLSYTTFLFAVSSIIAAFGVIGSLYFYSNALTTFSSRLGARTLFYHFTILLLRSRDPNVLEHSLNIIALMALSAVWIGGAIWAQFSEADIWGYKFCVGCQGWDNLRLYGGLIAAAEGVILGMSAALFIRSRATRSSFRDGIQGNAQYKGEDQL